MSSWGFRPYVSVAERRRRAAKEIEKLRKKGHVVAPIVIEGRKIARSFWSAIPTTRTGCRAGGPMSATAR